jgi:4-hydroxy-3-polyprenylbenzoate decarboxylase
MEFRGILPDPGHERNGLRAAVYLTSGLADRHLPRTDADRALRLGRFSHVLLYHDPIDSGGIACDIRPVARAKGKKAMKRIVIGISGATGTTYGIRLLQVLQKVEDVETHLVLTPAARRTLALETDFAVEQIEAMATFVHKPGDIAASISSGSFHAHGMIVAPCSIKTVSGIANSYSDNLLLRAADVMLKDHRPLVLLVRETPLHLGHLRLLVQVAEIGAIVMPPVPAFYHRPVSVRELVDQTVNRALDLLGIELPHDLFARWQGVTAPTVRPHVEYEELSLKPAIAVADERCRLEIAP